MDATPRPIRPMAALPHMAAALFLLFASFVPAAAQSDTALDELARGVERTESLRATKTLTYAFAQYAQFGLWDAVGDLFAEDGTFVFDGMVLEGETVTGPGAIADFLRARYGGGAEGMTADGLSAMMIGNPVINLSEDGQAGITRWNALIFHGHGGEARIEGGVLEVDYARGGGVWRIAQARYFPQFDGSYEDGWTNWGGGDLPIVPHHFTVESNGVPIPPPAGPAPQSDATLAELQARIDVLNDEDRIRNLQSIYGFYQDRKMWDDVVDLFAEDGVVEIGGQGVWRGKDGVRAWLEGTMGPAGLSHGQLNDQVQMDVTVQIMPGGNEAWARGIELGMLGEADEEKGWWSITTFRNRFVKEDGVWKLRELRRFPQMKTDIFQGWGKSRIVEPAPAGDHAPDAPVPAADAAPAGLAMPAFLDLHPVTGEKIGPAGDSVEVASAPLTGAIAPGQAAPVDLAEAQRRLARSEAWDGVMNVSAAYGYYVDDSMPAGFGGVLAEKGFKETPFNGYHIGRDRVLEARGTAPPAPMRPGISYHWLMQPAVFVSEDGRSASAHLRLFQPRTGKEVGEAGAFYGANFWGGVYLNQYVLEDGVWRIWDLTLDEPYIVPVAWKDGLWAKAKDPEEPRDSFFTSAVAPDISVKEMGERERHFWGGTGDTLQWPSILPMWFEFTNPVSGREPPHYQTDCAPCLVDPSLRLDRNGYQTPPDAPEANRAD